ncbi:MAG TPA: SUMF1/EgtB/PvdO family nonheme iron enzyme [Bacteroidales bacterium]|nr:SUMF1/EgtB/PvdO family nonheme iron enzyme [Bacteroidales bacterium]HPS73476.1 SUMF1/EgtB/PvdO family nonheme iron enzyme [Bacteroidales bacterium]
MKRLLIYFALLVILGSCGNSGNGELTGVNDRQRYYQPDPFGMVYIPMGSFTMGLGDENITYAQLNNPKTVSVQSYYMDQTEITNNEYRQFVYWVRDSIARRILGEIRPELFFVTENPKTGETFDPPFLNWQTRIEWNSEEQDIRDALAQMYLPEGERFFRRKEIDTRKLYYEYYFVDLKAAARKDYSQGGDIKEGGLANRPQGLKDRSVYVRKEVINVYPDTLCWLHDYAYSFNDPMTEKYFWHPAYDHYPVVGVTWKQANAFCIWRTQLKNSFLFGKKGEAAVSEFRLPTEAEWEWAARGGNDGNPYPWGGPYTRNDKGCFLANFKPMRGDYIDDGGLHTVIVAHYPANDFGLYDMAGNVAEWTSSTYNPSSYNFAWDLNPDYSYNAAESDPPIMKRKVIRGGSWKDVAYYIRLSTRAYEYQDTSKCYVGFRCVQSYMGRQKDDNPARASHVYN